MQIQVTFHDLYSVRQDSCQGQQHFYFFAAQPHEMQVHGMVIGTKWLIRPPCLSHCSEEEEEGTEKAADQVRKSQRQAAEGLQGRPRQDQAAAVADPSEKPAPAQAALPLLRNAQTPQHATQQRAQVPKTRVNPS
jgi:hypothetical protein